MARSDESASGGEQGSAPAAPGEAPAEGKVGPRPEDGFDPGTDPESADSAPLPSTGDDLPEHPSATVVVVLAQTDLAIQQFSLTGVLATTRVAEDEVLVVDDGGDAERAAWLTSLLDQHAQLRLLPVVAEATPAARINRGLAEAAREIAVVLDGDTIVPDGWLARLAGHLADTVVGLVGPGANRSPAEAVVAIDYVDTDGFARFAREQALAHDGVGAPVRVVPLFCAAGRREVFEGIGPFDEGYQGAEFVAEDYALRLKAAGCRLVWAQDVVVHRVPPAPPASTGPGTVASVADQRRFEATWGVRWEPDLPSPDTRPIAVVCSRPGTAFPVVTGGRLSLAGWTLAPAGVRSVDAIVDGARRERLDYGLPPGRTDLAAAYPGYPDPAACGFEGAVSVAGLADGAHQAVIRVSALDNRQIDLVVPFEIDAAAATSGRILAWADRPIPGMRNVVTEGHLPVLGWALSADGIERVEAVIDGTPRGVLTYGSLRPDVPAVYPEFPDVEHCGFVGIVPVPGLETGPHQAVIRVVSGAGNQVEIVRAFEVAPANELAGEAPTVNVHYAAWLDKHRATETDVAQARDEAAHLADPPTLSLLLDPADAPPELVEATVDSIRAQAYDGWELWLPGGRGGTQGDLVDRLARSDPRFKLAPPGEGEGFAPFANAACGLAAGAFLAAVDPGDLLSPLALVEIARLLAAEPETDLLYADEDKADHAGRRWDPFFKPDWSPDLLLAMDYVGPFAVYRRRLVQELGGFRPGLAGRERFDLTLRVAERSPDAGRIRHLPRLLFSRHAPVSEPRPGEVDPPASAPASRILTESLARRGADATVEPGSQPDRWRVRYALRDQPAVTIVLPTGGRMRFLRPCLDSIRHHTTYPNVRLLVVDNSGGTEVADLCDDLAAAGVAVRREPLMLEPFNFSALINHALPLVETPYLVLLNDDMTVVTPDWIEAMLEHAQRPEVGAVGCKLLYPDDTIQHAGVVFGPYQGSIHPFRHFPDTHPGYFGIHHVVRNVSAVTFACAMLRRDVVEEVGPLDEVNFKVAFNDADYCLRIRERGYRIIYTPHAVLHHYESVTKKSLAEPGEVAALRER